MEACFSSRWARFSPSQSKRNLGFLDLNVVGWVLIAAGVVGLILTTWFRQSRWRTVVTRVPAEERGTMPVESDRVEEEYREVRRPGRP